MPGDRRGPRRGVRRRGPDQPAGPDPPHRAGQDRVAHPRGGHRFGTTQSLRREARAGFRVGGGRAVAHRARHVRRTDLRGPSGVQPRVRRGSAHRADAADTAGRTGTRGRHAVVRGGLRTARVRGRGDRARGDAKADRARAESPVGATPALGAGSRPVAARPPGRRQRPPVDAQARRGGVLRTLDRGHRQR